MEFDKIMNGKNQKEFGAVIHLIANPTGLEIKLAKTFKSYAFGIKTEDINKIIFQNALNPTLTILSNSGISAEFKFSKEAFKEVFEFFYNNYFKQVNITNSEVKNFTSNYTFLSNLKKLTYSDRINRMTFFFWWFAPSLLLSIAVLNGGFGNIGIAIFSLIAAIFQLFFASKRYQDFNETPSNAFKLLIPIYSIYILIILLSKKGDVGDNNYGANPDFEEAYFQ